MAHYRIGYISGHRSYGYGLQLALKLDLDAYIMPAGMIYQFCMKQSDRYSKERLDEIANRSLNLIRRMDPGRTLVIERKFEGCRSIDKDNESGMRIPCHMK
ncbi:MAG: hypothetical protein IJ682_12695 [Lachnospiraceae bacterium]|nr:hypothetical protein [Lachnospiraceae bacterium]